MSAGVLLFLGTISSPDVTWQRIVGHGGLAFVASLPPLLRLWLGNRFATTPAADRTLGTGVAVMVACPFVLGVLAALSADPLAMPTLLYTPLLQVLIGPITIGLAAWVRDRGLPEDQAGERE